MTENKRRIHINKLNMIISVVVAFSAWLYVVYSVSPTTVKTYREVPVNYVGEDVLAEKGIGVESASVETITVKVRINRTSLSDFSESDIVATADVSEFGLEDTEIPISISVPSNVSVERSSHTRTVVKTARSNNIDVPVTVNFSDISEEGREPLASDLSFDEVSVMGAASIVNNVSYVAVVLDEESITKDGIDFKETPVAFDADGKALKHIVILPSEIEGHATIASVKKVALNVTVTDASNDSKVRTYEVPESIYIKGPMAQLSSITEVSAGAIITGIGTSQNVKLHYVLPDGIQIANSSLHVRLKLKVQ